MNNELLETLESLPRNSEYVFTSLENKHINQHTFNGVWNRLLDKMGIAHRIPYQLRHSMISYHANNGFPLQQLAEIVGNSVDIIENHYLKIDVSMIRLPETK